MLSAWRFERRGRALNFGRPPRHDLREITNAILYVDRTGCQWAYLPHDFPPHQSECGSKQNDGDVHGNLPVHIGVLTWSKVAETDGPYLTRQ